MRRLVLLASVVAAAAALLALLAFGVSSQGANSSIDSAVAHGSRPVAPAATQRLTLLGSSRTVSLAELRGRVVVVNIFASWCEPCKTEAPLLEREQRLLARRGATILGVTYLDAANASQTFVRQEHITYPVVQDVGGDFGHAFGITGVPETFVLDRHGRIVALRRFPVDAPWLAQTVNRVLGEPA